MSKCNMQYPVAGLFKFNLLAIQVNYPSKWILISNGFIVRHLGFVCLT